MNEKESKNYRILKMYDIFNSGGTVNKKNISYEFGVNERTVQRDLDDIRVYISENNPGNEIRYSSYKKGYYMHGVTDKSMTGIDLLSIIKIILESRAFSDKEMKGLINCLINQSKDEDRKFLKSIIGNELLHFHPLEHNKPLLQLIWDIGHSIHKKYSVRLNYTRMDGIDTVRVVHPISIIFSEYYFYLIAYIQDSEHHTPSFFRIDRIKECKQLNERFKISEKNRLEEGELRKRIHFMYAGDLHRIIFKFFGPSINAVLDKFPNAKIIEEDEIEWLVEVEVYGKGCIMWLLSQGENIEVISPKIIRDEMKEIVIKMQGRYE